MQSQAQEPVVPVAVPEFKQLISSGADSVLPIIHALAVSQLLPSYPVVQEHTHWPLDMVGVLPCWQGAFPGPMEHDPADTVIFTISTTVFTVKEKTYSPATSPEMGEFIAVGVAMSGSREPAGLLTTAHW